MPSQPPPALLRDLVNAPSPSGSEQVVGRLFREYTGRYADRVSTDVHGNVTAIVNPDAPTRIMLAAHMDEIGFIIHYINDDGLLHFSTIGGHDSVVLDGQMVWVHGRERVAGAIGRKAIHLLSPEESQRKPQVDAMWIDIGASSRAEAETVVQLGDFVTYQYEFRPLMGRRATGRGFDNKAGLFIVAEAVRLLAEAGALREDVGLYALGTVQEEIGSRGARTAAFGIDALTGLAVDMEHAVDYPGIDPARHGRIDLGKGPTVSRGANTNPVVFDLLCRAAAEEEIPFQVHVDPGSTPTDANAMQVNRAGMATGLVGIPLRYMHTPCEVVSLDDAANCARLLAAYCKRVTPGLDFTPR